MSEQPADEAPSWEMVSEFFWGREIVRGMLLGLAVVAVLLAHQRFAPDFELVDDDAVSSWQPIFTDFVRQLGEGHFPVWSHHTSCGYPLLGWPQPSFTYPPMWLAHGICRTIGFDAGEFYVAALMHAFLASSSSFVYLRRFGVHPLAATTGALGASLSGILLGLGSCWPTYIFAAAYWPMIFLCLEELRRPGPSPFWTVLLGLLGGLAFLFADLSLIVKFAILSGLYVMCRIEAATALGNVVRVGLAFAIALAVGVGQLIPSFEIIATSPRIGMGSNDFYTAPPRLWLGFAFPFATLPWEAHPFSATRAAGGFFVGPCALLGIAFAVRWLRAMRGPHRALIVLAAIYVGLAVGNLWPPNNWLQQLPVFSAMRWPFRWMFEASCVIALLSGFGLHLAYRDLTLGRGRGLLLAYAAVQWAVVVLRWPAPAGMELRAVFMVAVWAVGLAALWTFAAKKSAEMFLATACLWTAVAMVANIPVAQETRMARMTRLLDDPLTVGRDTHDRVLFLARHGELVAAQKEGNLSRLFPHRFGTRSVLGYVYRPPSQAWMTGFELDGLIYENEPDIARRFLGPNTTILSTLRVGHVVVFKTNRVLDDACAANPNLELDGESAYYRVYRNAGFKSPAFAVRKLKRETGASDLVELGLRVRMPDEALVEPDYDGPMSFAGRAAVDSFREHHGLIEFDVDADKDAFVVVTTTLFPRWRATVGGVEVPLVRVNGSFMGLGVPPGRHAVRIEYRPIDHLIYLAVSGVALAATIAACALLARRMARTRDENAGVSSPPSRER